MTDFDKKLIEKAGNMSCWDFRKVDVLILIADTDEAKEALRYIRWEYYDSVNATL